MTRANATIAAQAESTASRLNLAIVREGPHADEFVERDTDGESYGYCPVLAVSTLYPHGERVDIVTP